jgi:hypothetical protein
MDWHIGRFIAKAAIVARPVCVSPTKELPSQRKWLAHSHILGLNMGTFCPVSGSIASVRAAFRKEHETHAKAKLSDSVEPPNERGTTWSM